MITACEANKALKILKENRGVTQLCSEMGWPDLSPLAEAIHLRILPTDLGRVEDLYFAYSIQSRQDVTHLFPQGDTKARFEQRTRRENGLVNLTSKVTDDFIIHYAFPKPQTPDSNPRPKPQTPDPNPRPKPQTQTSNP